MTSRQVDLAVVGGGIVGLATASALLDRCADFVLFEPRRPGSGQSRGPGRIFRRRHRDPNLVELAERAAAGWCEWERRFGRTLLLPGPGQLVSALPDGSPPPAAELMRPLTPAAGRALLPAYAAPPGPVWLDEGARTIDAAAAIAALAQRVRPCLAPAAVDAVELAGEGVVLRAGGTTWRAGQVLLCAGDGTAALAAEAGLGLALIRRGHIRGHYAVRFDSQARACLADGRAYGLPLPGGRYAIGLSSANPELVAGQAGLSPAQERACLTRLDAYVRSAWPGLHPTPVGAVSCVVTAIEDADDPDRFEVHADGPLLAIAGTNLFKFAPVLGGLLAEAFTGGRLPSWVMSRETVGACAPAS